ncbi:MAG TPA: AAA family ATPase [bacterium]|nr:AAA family ATPase [bacterium]
MIETHISWILLTGPFAYKIKKPVNLGFCDFTTLEKRKFYCEEELRLNRRLAPELYVEIVPVTGTEDAPRLGGDGPVIDYAVKMVQFDQACRLDRVLSAGGLLPEHMDQFASQLAAFHGAVPAAAPESPYGNAQSVARTVLETLGDLDSLENASLVADLRSWCGSEAVRLKEVFEARKDGGFVRECHGDAHLANAALIDGRIRIFDAIDFNPDLRWIDVMSETAFAAMDLQDRGRPDLARRFLNAYLERTGDYEGLRAFRFYEVYRAQVRAKVAAIRLSQEGLAPAERAEIRAEAEGYLALALKLTRPEPPKLSITFGVSGSGKTHGTQRILETEGAVRLRTDVERKRLFGIDPFEGTPPSRKEEVYGADASRRVYRRLLDLSWMLLSEGHSLIVDGTFLKRSERDEFRALAAALAVPFRILSFEAPDDVLKRRVSARRAAGADASEADWEIVERQKRRMEPLTPDEKGAMEEGV